MTSQPVGSLPVAQGQPLTPPPTPSVLQTAWRRRGIILAGACLGLLVGVIYYCLHPPLYQSTAEVAIQPKHSDLLGGAGQDTGHDGYVTAQVARLRSPVMVEQAVHEAHLGDLPSLAAEPHMVAAVLRSLTISRGRNQFGENNLVALSFKGSQADDCPVVLHAILEANQRYLASVHAAETSQAVKTVLNARDSIEQQLGRQEQAYADFRNAHPLVDKGTAGTSPLQHRLDDLQSRRSALIVRRAELTSKVAAAWASKKRGDPAPQVLAALQGLAPTATGDNSARDRLVASQEQLMPLLLDERRLLQSFGANHPDVRGARERIETARAVMAVPGGLWSAGPSTVARMDLAIEQQLAYLNQQIQEIDGTDERLGREERATATELVELGAKDDAYRSNLARTQQLYDNIVKRLQDQNLSKDAGGYELQIISPASTPEKIAPSAVLILPTCTFLGLLGGIGLAYRLANRDERYRSADELTTDVGLPVLAAIPSFERSLAHATQDRHSTVDSLLCTVCRPGSVDAEAFRLLRTAFFFNTRERNHQVIQVTSPGRGDGKTTVACNLAVAIAHCGRSVILMDANLTLPGVHQVFGMVACPGLRELLSGTADLASVLRPTEIANLVVIPAGISGPDATELCSSQGFDDLLGRLRTQANFIVIDSPALLGTADAAVVATKVDGVVLTVRVGSDTRRTVAEARRRLARVGSRVLGAVINEAETGTDAGQAGYVRRGGNGTNGWPAGRRTGDVMVRGASAGAASANGSDADGGGLGQPS